MAKICSNSLDQNCDINKLLCQLIVNLIALSMSAVLISRATELILIKMMLIVWDWCITMAIVLTTNKVFTQCIEQQHYTVSLDFSALHLCEANMAWGTQKFLHQPLFKYIIFHRIEVLWNTNSIYCQNGMHALCFHEWFLLEYSFLDAQKRRKFILTTLTALEHEF